ncbi:hypothetical protein HH310_22615 [Actinoplanes sp. TBRC 11911]|uniref:hypothetical protein n=1 Tax=Actinoplanes sp. TBRC 11911 TaxID=2729386 RepID=UPI00145D72EA|nr:hypothetical protein [Actinoplanes sp. TBRC 11911]NMO53961.1 hypothetical protein [Actinoplanes sp. TBRC 11911]
MLREAGLQERYFAKSLSGTDDMLAAVHDEVDAYFFDLLMRDLNRSAPRAPAPDDPGELHHGHRETPDHSTPARIRLTRN